MKEKGIDPKPKRERKYLHIIMDPSVHKEIRQRALMRNVTASKYVMDAIMARIRLEKQYE